MGDPHADLMFVGEGPGAEEDQRGRPFVGRSGKLLDQLMMEEIGITRDRCYIANVVKCRPPGNRDPLPDEVATCRPYLEQQLDLIDPKRRRHARQLRHQAAARHQRRHHQAAGPGRTRSAAEVLVPTVPPVGCPAGRRRRGDRQDAGRPGAGQTRAAGGRRVIRRRHQVGRRHPRAGRPGRRAGAARRPRPARRRPRRRQDRLRPGLRRARSASPSPSPARRSRSSAPTTRGASRSSTSTSTASTTCRRRSTSACTSCSTRAAWRSSSGATSSRRCSRPTSSRCASSSATATTSASSPSGPSGRAGRPAPRLFAGRVGPGSEVEPAC